MDMDKHTPGYDRTLELLCSLPAIDLERCTRKVPQDDRPTGALLATLARDFGHDRQDPIRRLITETQVRHRVSISVFHGPDGLCAGIATQHYPKARMLAEAYWDRIYGSRAEVA